MKRNRLYLLIALFLSSALFAEAEQETEKKDDRQHFDSQAIRIFEGLFGQMEEDFYQRYQDIEKEFLKQHQDMLDYLEKVESLSLDDSIIKEAQSFIREFQSIRSLNSSWDRDDKKCHFKLDLPEGFESLEIEIKEDVIEVSYQFERPRKHIFQILADCDHSSAQFSLNENTLSVEFSKISQ